MAEKEKTILVVDLVVHGDHFDSNRFEQYCKHQGHTVITTKSPDEAKKIISSNKISLTLIDYCLYSEPLGLLLILWIKENFGTQLKIISMSVEQSNKETAILAGADEFYPKAYHPEILYKKIDNLLKDELPLKEKSRVLLFEDNSITNNAITDLFSKEFDLISTKECDKAYSLIINNEFDAIIINIAADKNQSSAFELINLAAARKPYNLVITASTNPLLKDAAMHKGATDFLHIADKQMLAKINDHLSKRMTLKEINKLINDFGLKLDDIKNCLCDIRNKYQRFRKNGGFNSKKIHGATNVGIAKIMKTSHQNVGFFLSQDDFLDDNKPNRHKLLHHINAIIMLGLQKETIMRAINKLHNNIS